MVDRTPRIASDERSAWAAAEDYGCDMSLVESNLRKTPAERIRVHGRALAAALALKEAIVRSGRPSAGQTRASAARARRDFTT
jgi:hypothetical protein